MLRCSAEAWARCPTRKYCGLREDATFTEGSECDKFNQHVSEHPVSRADRIRAMNDDELIKLLKEFTAFACIFPDKDCEFCSCEDCVTQWLRESTEEEYQ